eukprot:TRINITY_DN646_c0_g1_i4.p4 TRINITY_DN646_c0_g1~~TRINITY_DN646_c0_g1_i4.p4  ORF type:complete len:103 (+),score=5.37 TRINITY_DN646_c0_g1_i4:131-439(+)
MVHERQCPAQDADASLAYCRVHSRALANAAASSRFHRSAASLFSGSSGLGAASSAWMDSSTVRICSAGLHIFLMTSRQIRPKRSMLGWYRRVKNRTLGGAIG